MLTKTMQDAINGQIQKEFSSAYSYLAMAAHCEEMNLPGFAHWFRAQSQEEHGHAMKLFDFVHDRGGRVILEAIGKPPAKFSSVLDVFQQTLEQERKVSASIHQLYASAVHEKDYPTEVILQWFITEQVEEEKTAVQMVEQLKMIGDAAPGLLMLDRQMAGPSAS